MRRRRSEYVPARDRISLSAGDVIRISCEMMDITQVELARRAGLHAPHLSDIVNGKRAVGKAVAERIARVLKIPPAHILFAGERTRKGLNPRGAEDSEVVKRVIQARKQTVSLLSKVLKKLRSNPDDIYRHHHALLAVIHNIELARDLNEMKSLIEDNVASRRAKESLHRSYGK